MVAGPQVGDIGEDVPCKMARTTYRMIASHASIKADELLAACNAVSQAWNTVVGLTVVFGSLMGLYFLCLNAASVAAWLCTPLLVAALVAAALVAAALIWWGTRLYIRGGKGKVDSLVKTRFEEVPAL